jgi:hypothetical protein
MPYKHDGRLYTDGGELSCAYKTGPIVPAGKHQGWSVNSLGQPFVTFDPFAATDNFGNGQRFTADGAAYITAAEPTAADDTVHDGIRRTFDGRLYVKTGAFSTSDDTFGGIRKSGKQALFIAGTAFASYVSSLTPIAWHRYGVGLTTASGSIVTQWADQSGNANHLLASSTVAPILQADNTVLFDGAVQYMQCAAFTLNQPETVYVLFKQITWTSLDRVFDGGGPGMCYLRQVTGTPQLQVVGTGSALAASGLLPLNTYGAIACIYNGASSVFRVNNEAETTGTVDAVNAGGFTLGAAAGGGAYGNIQVLEDVVFPVAHDAVTRARVVRHLAQVGNLSI